MNYGKFLARAYLIFLTIGGLLHDCTGRVVSTATSTRLSSDDAALLPSAKRVAAPGDENYHEVSKPAWTAFRPVSTFEKTLDVAAESFISKLRTIDGQAAEAISLLDSQVPPTRQMFHFRPVSVTLRCVLALTFLFLTVYILLAVARNTDELQGAIKPSLFTEVMTVAARGAVYSPMLAALFIACRMHVLQSSNGLGEPQTWVKVFMIVITCGMYLQVILIVSLPLMLQSRSRTKFAALAGESFDVHPNLFQYGYTFDKLFHVAWILQLLALLPIYVGVVAVIVGVIVYPVETSVSPAVISVMILSAWYFWSQCVLFVARTRQQLLDRKESESKAEDGKAEGTSETTGETSADNSGRKFEKFALSATYPMEVSAMLAVLILATRMRAVQLNRFGSPQIWAQVCFLTCACVLPIMSLVNGYSGMVGNERFGYYGQILYDAPGSKLAIVKHCFAAIVYIGLLVIVISIFTLQAPKPANTPPVSPTVYCVMQLSCQFFTVYGVSWLLAAAVRFHGTTKALRIAQDTVLAARASVQFCPILALLFVGCRMRALQITDGHGSPQGWAQSTMYLVVFATTIQVLCCLALPIFTGVSTKTDGEGNAEYDLRPLIGAYVVTVVKYVMLFVIFGGVIVVGISMFSITPETANADVKFSAWISYAVYTVLILLLVVLVAMVLSSAKVVGLAIKFAVEKADQGLLGVDVDVGVARVSLCRGFVNLERVLVHNPEGYETPYLLSVGTMVFKLSVWQVIKSKGKTFEIEALMLKNVDVIYEKSSSSSNVHDILQKLEGDKKENKEKELDEAIEKAQKDKKEDEEAEKKKTEPPKEKAEVILHKVHIDEIGAKVAAHVLGGTHGMRVALGNIDYDDFQEKCHGKVEVQEVVVVVLKTLLKTVVANTGIVGQAAEHVVAGARKAVGAVAGKAEEAGAKAFHAVENTKVGGAVIHKTEEIGGAAIHKAEDMASGAYHKLGYMFGRESPKEEADPKSEPSAKK